MKGVFLTIFCFFLIVTTASSSDFYGKTSLALETEKSIFNSDYTTARKGISQLISSPNKKEELYGRLLQLALYRDQGEYDLIEKNLDDDFDLYNSINESELATTLLIEVGLMHYYQNSFAKALKVFKKAESYSLKLTDEKKLITSSLKWMAMSRQGQPFVARANLERAYQSFDNTNKLSYCVNMFALSEVYSFMQLDQRAIKILEKLKLFTNENCVSALISKNQASLSLFFLRMGEADMIGLKAEFLDVFSKISTVDYKSSISLQKKFARSIMKNIQNNTRMDDNITFELLQYINFSSSALASNMSYINELKGNVEQRTLYEKYRKLLSKYSALSIGNKSNPVRASREKHSIVYKQLELLEMKLNELGVSVNGLSSFEPLSILDVQKNLRKNEALFFSTDIRMGGYHYIDGFVGFFITNKHFSKVTLGEFNLLKDKVRNLRASLRWDKISVFDVNTANSIYEMLFSSVDSELKNIKRIFTVMNGSLSTIPLSILVTESWPKNQLLNYHKVKWFNKKYSTLQLPSVRSILSKTEKPMKKSKINFVGIGNPVLYGKSDIFRGVVLNDIYDSSGDVKGSIIDTLPPLPETEKELFLTAESLNLASSIILVSNNATESKLKELNLNDADVISFATHALVAGEFSGLKEPALVLTPPKYRVNGDDGLLTASEIMKLELDAELVVLSACNTANSEGVGSGLGVKSLADAFIYAGTKRVIVSHWPVHSDAAVRLISNFFNAYSKKSDVTMDEALQEAMNEVMETYPSPGFWAPFIIIGNP